MTDFLEKLKKGMGIKISVKEPEQKKEEGLKEDKSSSPPLAAAREVKESKLSSSAEIEVKKEDWFEPEGELAIDVYQTEEEIVVQSPIAGIRPENLDIFVENDVLSIRGNRQKPDEIGQKDYFYQECYWGLFSRQVILPKETDPSRIIAEMKEGVLIVRIPKVKKEKSKKIIIKN
ncbi:MAG: Hsp20/alpha crystallin family protein [Candidatus Nealsonbacteria bacterium]|nr:Hsp20/alpha crystallin family protein [Candidatus Nealsonbacteria bacterium]